MAPLLSGMTSHLQKMNALIWQMLGPNFVYIWRFVYSCVTTWLPGQLAAKLLANWLSDWMAVPDSLSGSGWLATFLENRRISYTDPKNSHHLIGLKIYYFKGKRTGHGKSMTISHTTTITQFSPIYSDNALRSRSSIWSICCSVWRPVPWAWVDFFIIRLTISTIARGIFRSVFSHS